MLFTSSCSIHNYVRHTILCMTYYIMYGHALYFYSCQRYQRVEYAGALFRTEKSQRSVKHDDANVRMDYTAPGERVVQQAYAKIQSLFVHEAFPGGPRRYVLEGNWYKVVGVCPVFKTNFTCWSVRVLQCPSTLPPNSYFWMPATNGLLLSGHMIPSKTYRCPTLEGTGFV